MTISLAASATTGLPSSAGAGPSGASQNLFEHMANNARVMTEGASPPQIGSNLMERLNGFIDRSRSFSARADMLTNGPSIPSQPLSGIYRPGPSVAGEQGKKVAEQQVDQIVHSLGKMFDYSIETQMVVRGATQISGSANTLLKGQ